MVWCVGLTADARILINWARVECQSYRLRLEDPITVENITSHLASICQVGCTRVCVCVCRILTALYLTVLFSLLLTSPPPFPPGLAAALHTKQWG